MKLRSKMQNQKGFTLVELMVVVVILGILVAIAVPVYSSVQERAEKNACHANLRTIDGMKTQWQLMDATEQGAVGDFEDMFVGGIPTCPAGGTYTNVDPLDKLPATCEANDGKGGHGTY